MSELTPSLPPEEEEVVGELGEGEMLGGNVEVDHTPLQEQLARNKECKYLKLSALKAKYATKCLKCKPILPLQAKYSIMKVM